MRKLLYFGMMERCSTLFVIGATTRTYSMQLLPIQKLAMEEKL